MSALPQGQTRTDFPSRNRSAVDISQSRPSAPEQTKNTSKRPPYRRSDALGAPIISPTTTLALACADEALQTGDDPYKIEPVRTCQRTMMHDAGLQLKESHILPPPMPPVTLILFAIISVLPTDLTA